MLKDEWNKIPGKLNGKTFIPSIYLLIVIFNVALIPTGHSQVKSNGIPGVVNYSKSVYNAGTQNWGIAQDSNGFMFFANNNGVLRFDGVHWDLIEVSQSSAVRSIHIDDANTIYVGLYNDFGTIQNDGAGNYYFKSLRDYLPGEIPNFDEIWKIYSTPEGIVFQSFDYLFVYNTHEIHVIEPDNRFQFSFLINEHYFLNEPDEGLYELKNGVKEKHDWSAELAGMEVWGMAGRTDSSLIIGTSTNGLYLMEEGELKKWDTEVGRMVEKFQLYCMASVGENHFAFGTILNGLFISDSNGEIVQHMNISNGLQNNTILSIHTDEKDNLWLGLDNGIDYLNINSPITFINGNDNIGTGYASIIHDGRLYLGTNQGLYVKSFGQKAPVDEDFQLIENTVGQVWSIDVFNDQLICGHNSGTFLVEGDDAVRIGREEGVWKYIPLAQNPGILLGGNYNGLFTLKNDGDGWVENTRIRGFNESSRFIGQDDRGMIWVSHGAKGVYRIELNESLDSVVNFKLYNAENGLPSSEHNILLQFIDQLYLSTIKGIYKYSYEEDVFKPTEDLSKLDINGQLKTIESDDSGNHWYITDLESGVFRLNEDLTYTKVTLPFRQLDNKYVNGFEFIYPYNDEHILFGTDIGFAHYTSKFNKRYNTPLKAFITQVEASYLDSVVSMPDTGYEGYRFPYDKNAFRIHYSSPFYEHQGSVQYSFNLEDYQNEWSPWSEINYKDFTNLPQGEYKFNLKARNLYGLESDIAVFRFTIMPPWYKSASAKLIYLLVFLGMVWLLYKLVQFQIEKTKRRVIHNHQTMIKLKEEQFQLQKLLTEKEIIKLRNEKLEGEMVFRNKELANQTMGLIQKNKFLVDIKDELVKIGKNIHEEKIKQRLSDITRNINKEIDNKQQHQLFETYFEEVHYDFFKSLKGKFPELTPREMRLCAYLRMNLTSKEIAALLNISDRGVEISRYRLRKKMQLSRDTNLSTFLSNI